MVHRFNAARAALAVAGFVLAYAASAGALHAQSASPQRIGFVDMAEVFKRYEKFIALRDELKRDFENTERQGKAMLDQIKQVQGEMQQLSADHPDYAQREQQIVKLQSELEVLRRKTEREIMERTAKINKLVYLEVIDMINRLARSNNYSMVLRISHPPENLDDDPAMTMQWMNQLVVNYDPADDLTEDVIKWLNQRYSSSASAAPRENVVPAVPRGNPAGQGVVPTRGSGGLPR